MNQVLPLKGIRFQIIHFMHILLRGNILVILIIQRALGGPDSEVPEMLGHKILPPPGIFVMNQAGQACPVHIVRDVKSRRLQHGRRQIQIAHQPVAYVSCRRSRPPDYQGDMHHFFHHIPGLIHQAAMASQGVSVIGGIYDHCISGHPFFLQLIKHFPYRLINIRIVLIGPFHQRLPFFPGLQRIPVMDPFPKILYHLRLLCGRFLKGGIFLYLLSTQKILHFPGNLIRMVRPPHIHTHGKRRSAP